MYRATLRMLAVVLAFGLISCDSSPTDDGDDHAIAISLSPSTLSITAGESGEVTVNLTRAGGYTGSVSVGIDPATGVTAAPATIGTGDDSATLDLQVDPAAEAGTVSVTVRASGQGVDDAVATAEVTITAAAAPDFELSATPEAVTVERGATAEVEVEITRSGGFTGAVEMGLEGLPEGVTGTFEPADPTEGNATLTLTAADDAATGEVELSISGTSEGIGAKSISVTLTVTEPAPAGDYSLGANPPAVTVQQGATTTTTIAITRTDGFEGEVTLAVTGLPTGVEATFDPAATTGDASTLTLTAAADAEVGDVALEITGTAEGLDDRTADLDLTVAMATGGAGNVAWTFCGFTGVPEWFAYRDGDGEWTPVDAEAGNSYRFQIDADRGQLAWVIDEGNGPQTTVAHYSRDEMILAGQGQCDAGSPGKTVHGSVTGLGALETAFVTLGGATAPMIAAAAPTFTLNHVPQGPQDLVASRTTFGPGGTGVVPDRMIIRRDLDPADGSTLPALDFGAEGFDLLDAQLSLNGMTGDEQSTVSGMFSTNRAATGSYFAGVLGGATQTYWGVPQSEMTGTDLHWLQVIAIDAPTGGAEPVATRQVGVAFREVQDRAVTFGPPLAEPTFQATAGAPTTRFIARWDRQPEYGRFVVFAVHQPGSAVQHGVTLLATEGYLGSATGVELEMPDLTGVAGWDPAYELEPATTVETFWTVTGSGWVGDGTINFPVLDEGTEYLAATRTGPMQFN